MGIDNDLSHVYPLLHIPKYKLSLNPTAIKPLQTYTIVNSDNNQTVVYDTTMIFIKYQTPAVSLSAIQLNMMMCHSS